MVSAPLLAQQSVGLGYEFSFLSTSEQTYNYNVGVYNKNETIDFYNVRNKMGAVAHGLSIRSYGSQFFKKQKIAVGYSLDLGYSFFQGESEFAYLRSSTSNRDSIVNLYDDLKFRSNYHTIRFNHYLDVHWNPSESTKITNSIGVGIAAIVKGSTKQLGYEASIINNNHPILKLVYQPQITERYEKLSITYFASIDLFAFSLFQTTTTHSILEQRIPFQKLRFNTIGLRFVPNPKLKPKIAPEDILID